MSPGTWPLRSMPFVAESPISRKRPQPVPPVAADTLKSPWLGVVERVHSIGMGPPRGRQWGGIVTAGSPRLAIRQHDMDDGRTRNRGRSAIVVLT